MATPPTMRAAVGVPYKIRAFMHRLEKSLLALVSRQVVGMIFKHWWYVFGEAEYEEHIKEVCRGPGARGVQGQECGGSRKGRGRTGTGGAQGGLAHGWQRRGAGTWLAAPQQAAPWLAAGWWRCGWRRPCWLTRGSDMRAGAWAVARGGTAARIHGARGRRGAALWF
jgi:hypothetical protein